MHDQNAFPRTEYRMITLLALAALAGLAPAPGGLAPWISIAGSVSDGGNKRISVHMPMLCCLFEWCCVHSDSTNIFHLCRLVLGICRYLGACKQFTLGTVCVYNLHQPPSHISVIDFICSSNRASLILIGMVNVYSSSK